MKTGIQIIDIILPLEESQDQEIWKKRASRQLNIPPKAIWEIRLIKHSIDARKTQIKIQGLEFLN